MKILEYYHIFAYISSYSVLVPIFFSIKRYSAFNTVLKVLFLYLLLSLGAEIANIVLLRIGLSNAIVMDIFAIIELLLISYIYYNVFGLNLSWRKANIILPVIFVGIYIICLYLHFNFVFYAFYSLLIIVYALIYFYTAFNDPNETDLIKNYFFWINCGILFYFGTSFFLFLFRDFIVSSDLRIARLLWSIHLLVNFLFYIFLSIGICKIRSK